MFRTGVQVPPPVMHPALERAPGDTRELCSDFGVVAVGDVVDDALLYVGCEASGFNHAPIVQPLIKVLAC